MSSEHTSQPRTISKGKEFFGTGIPSLDAIIGGGFPVGSVILINEDESNIYSELFLQAFIAQGVINNDHVLVASNDRDTKKLVESLPHPGDLPVEEAGDDIPLGSMQIAWRYESSYKPRVDVNRYRALSNNFYFKGPSKSELDKSNIKHWPGNGPGLFSDLESTIVQTLKDNSLLNDQRKNSKSILRVAVQSLGSFLWMNEQNEVPKLLYRLRSICHLSRSIILITMPAHLMEESMYVTRSEQMCDIVMTLTTIDGESNPLYKEYNGLIKFEKASPIKSLCSSVTEGNDWAFKLLKKRLLIERLTLPPELSSSTQREQDTLSCSTSNRALQF